MLRKFVYRAPPNHRGRDHPRPIASPSATQRNAEALLSSPTRVARKSDIATNSDIGGQVGVTYEKENDKEEDASRAHYVGSRVVRLTL